MIIYAYALQDSIGRFLTYYNRGYVMNVGNPKLYKTPGHAAKAREKLTKFYGLKIKRIKLEVLDDHVYKPFTGGTKDSRRNARSQQRPNGPSGVEAPNQGLPVGALQAGQQN